MRVTFTFLFIFYLFGLFAQEICNNGIDDDNDSLIDLNDDDCACSGSKPVSLIPNPSFEDRTCCPTFAGALNCADDWIQASTPTTDYVHTCGILSNPYVPYDADAPLPFPDGQGAIGFRDGKSGNSNYKEYAGACLNNPMVVGTDYRLDFYVGFNENPISREFPMAIFGTTNCSALPFGNGNEAFGCPANDFNWDLIGELEVTGNDEWVNVVFDFTVNKAYKAIALGPSCDPHPNYNSHPYFFFDNLVLSEEKLFGIPFAAIEGGVCKEEIKLSVEMNPNQTYQWYRDGIALVGETNNTLEVKNPEEAQGKYLLLIEENGQCFRSEEYVAEIPDYVTNYESFLCPEEIIIWEQDTINTPGNYEKIIKAMDGCDSLLVLDLLPGEISEVFMMENLCNLDTFRLDYLETTVGGQYEIKLTNRYGCDSIIYLDLILVDQNEGVDLGDDLEVDLGDNYFLIPEFVDANVIQFEWYINNNLKSNSSQFEFNESQIGNYQVKLTTTDENGCTASDRINVTLSKNIRLFVPNIFSPNEDGFNDIFKVGANKTVSGIQEVKIYNRWGEMVYQHGAVQVHDFPGWDGNFKNSPAPQGVYTYMFTLNIIDGSREIISGDLTLIR